MQNGNGKARKSGSPGQTHLLYFALYWIMGGGRGLLRSVGSCLFLLLESKRTFLIQTMIVGNHHMYYCVTINLTGHK